LCKYDAQKREFDISLTGSVLDAWEVSFDVVITMYPLNTRSPPLEHTYPYPTVNL